MEKNLVWITLKTRVFVLLIWINTLIVFILFFSKKVDGLSWVTTADF